MTIVITDIREHQVIDVDTDKLTSYRRYSASNWDELMGESWEPIYYSDKAQELEQAYQNYLADNNRKP